MASKGSVFVLGPGFIGGEIIQMLVDDGYRITTLVRREAAAKEYNQQGVATVMGTLSDSEIISQQVAEHDIVFHTATADDLPSVEAVLEGVKQRAGAGKSTIYIHTSGTSLIGDRAFGEYKGDKIFHDDRPEQIDALPNGAPHREIDLAIVEARKALGTKAKLAIMIPPLIYGVSRAKRLSIQLPTYARFAMKHRYAGVVGKGLPVWSQVHVSDLARGCLTILHWMERTDATEVLKNPYWFCENGEEVSWRDAVGEIGKVLHEAGRVDSPDVRTIPPSDYTDLFGDYTPHVVGTNSRSRANKLRRLGWEPREKKTLTSLKEDELPIMMNETGSFGGYAAPVASGTK